MKSMKVSIMALAVILAGVTGAVAQSAGPYFVNAGAMDYPLHEIFPSAVRFAYTAGIPRPTTTDLETVSGAVATDGGGRGDGLVYAHVYFGGPLNHSNNYSAFTMTVIGKNSNRGTNPLVKLSLRGTGYYFDGVTNHPNASLALNFNSTNQLTDVFSTQVTVNSNNYSVTYADGSTQLFTNGPATMTNSRFAFLSGALRGNIAMGKNGGPTMKISETAAVLTAGTNWFVVNGTNFVEMPFGGGLILDVFTNMDAQAIQPVPGSRLYLNANAGSLSSLLQGIGSANYSGARWSASFSGVAFTRGCTMQANGTLGPAIVAYAPTSDTNFPSGIPLLATNVIQTMTITGGKFYGQRMPNNNNVGFSVWPTNSLSSGF